MHTLKYGLGEMFQAHETTWEIKRYLRRGKQQKNYLYPLTKNLTNQQKKTTKTATKAKTAKAKRAKAITKTATKATTTMQQR